MSILPSPARVNDELSLDITASDTDGHTVTFTYDWMVNGLSVSTTTPTLLGQFIRGDEVSVSVTPSDGLVEGQAVSASTVIENTAPALSAVSLDPTEIYEDTVVNCEGSGWDDPDGDTETDLVKWTVDGAEVASGGSISGDLFSRGDEIVCTITPFDGEEMGSPVDSDPSTVLNSVPVVSSVGFSTLSPTSLSGITALPVADDTDGDTLTYAYYWTVGGQPIMLPTDTATLSSADFEVGDTITVTVSACDPEACGVGVPSAETAVVVNSAPEMISVTLAPSPEAGTDDIITATVSTSDDDGDSVAVGYEWFVNGVSAGQSTPTLDGTTYFAKGDTLFVTATPTDGSDAGAALSSAVVAVVNTAPTSPVVEVTPERPVAGDHDLQCVIVTESQDADGEAVSYTFAWSVDGVDAGNSTSTVATADIQAGETWECVVTPDDGEEVGLAGVASTIVANWPENWINAYYEDFSDGEAEDFETYGGACGGQSGELDVDGSTYLWRFTSDLNGARLPIPDLGTTGLAFESRLRFFNESTASAVRWRSNQVTWDANDDAGYTLNAQLGVSAETFGEDEICVDFCTDGVALVLEPETWFSYRVEEWDGEYRVFVDEQQVLEGDIADLPSAGDSLEFAGGGDCGSPVLEIDYVVIQSAVTLSENTPPEAPVANLRPLVPRATVDDLTCVVDVPSFDLDGDVADYQFDWTVNGSSFDQTADTYATGDTVPAASVNWGDHWECVVTPNDGKVSGISTAVDVVVVPRDCAAPQSADGSLAQVASDPALSLDSGDFTVEAWVQPTSALDTADQRILGVFDGTYTQWVLEYNATQGGIGALFSDGVSQITVYSSDSLSVGNWHHVAVTRAVDEFTVWIDGAEAASASNSATLASLSSDLFIGNIADEVDGWQGLVDEVRISSAARYTSGFTPARTLDVDGDTVGLWHLDSRSTSIYDASGNGYHGEITDGSWSDASSCDVFRASVAAGGSHTCTLSESGVVCMGDDTFGQSSGPMGDYRSVYAGLKDSCAISDTYQVECWGQLAYSSGAISAATDLGLGWFHRCAVAIDDTVQCWGVADGSIFDFGQVSDAPAIDVVDVAAGAYYSCAVGHDGQLACWGRDLYGEASPPTGTYESVSAGLYHACALDTLGEVSCWGIEDGSGEDGGQVSSAPAGSYVAVTSGDYHSCALDGFGSVTCWGRDDEGQASPPVGAFADVSAGGLHSCAVDAAGSVECWGSDDGGQVSGGGWDTGDGGEGLIPPGECASLNLDGVDDFAYLADGTSISMLGTSVLSLEFWVRPDTVGMEMTLFQWGDDDLSLENEFIWLQLDVDGKVVATVRGDNGANEESTVTSSRVLVPGVWAHVHLQRDPGNTLELFIDGVLEMTAVEGAGIVNLLEARPVLLGVAYDFSTGNRVEAFDGSFSEVRAWSRLLDSVELVDKSYQQLDPGSEIGLFGYWPLDEGAGAAVLDLASGDYGQVYDNVTPYGDWNIGSGECRVPTAVGDTGDTGGDTAVVDTAAAAPIRCADVAAKVDGVTVFDAQFDFASLQSLTYPGWTAYPAIYLGNEIFNTMAASVDDLLVTDTSLSTLVADDFSDPSTWRVMSGVLNCGSTDVSGGVANARSDANAFRGTNQAFLVDGGVSMSFRVQVGSATDQLALWFTDQAADANCATCDGAQMLLCNAQPWLGMTLDRQAGTASVWLEQASNSIEQAMSGSAFPPDNTWSTVELLVVPTADCATVLDSGHSGLNFSHTGN
jgi:hypothetical protein